MTPRDPEAVTRRFRALVSRALERAEREWREHLARLRQAPAPVIPWRQSKLPGARRRPPAR